MDKLELKIPKIIHQIWIGPKKPPINLMNTLREIYDDWQYILWNEEEIEKNFPNGLKNQKQFNMFANINRYDGMSDVLRYEILEKFGGFYCDADTFALNKLSDEFLRDSIFFSYENEEKKEGLIANGYIGCEPNNEFIKKIINKISLIENIFNHHHAWQLTGPQLITDTVLELNHEELNPIKIYNSDFFIPYWYEKCQFKDNMIVNKCYSNHIWGSKKDIGNVDDFFNISNYNYTLVSAYIPKLNDYSDKSLNKYLNHGRELLMLPIPKIIFLPEELITWGLNNSNKNFTKIIKFEKDDMYNFFWNDLSEEEKTLIQKPIVASAEFPGQFNVKDTLDYLICQNHKSQWLKIASDLNFFNKENFVWIDFGISHILKDNNLFDLFETKINQNQKILIPSLKIKNDSNNEILNVKLNLNIANWYTLGGILCSNKELINKFNDLCKNEIIQLLKNEKFITWEVNIWTLIIQKNIDFFKLYSASFDKSIIKNLFENHSINLEKLKWARETSQHYLAFEYYNALKQDHEYYRKNQEKIDYEMTILHYYCFKNQKVEGAKFLINYLNQFSLYENNVWTNLKYYVEALNQHKNAKIKSLQHLELKNQNFKNTSPCKLVMKNGEEHINIRYVNYEYDENNNISLINKKSFSNENPVRTKNLYNGEIELKMNEQDFSKSSNMIEGFEDIRLFEKDNKIKFLATTKGYSKSPDQFNVITGDYDVINHEVRLEKIFPSPDLDKCEKNWVMLNEDEMIYKWSPVRIYDYENLQLQRSYTVPKIFNRFRGSSNVINIDNFNYCVVHTVHYENPRKYLHWIVKLNQEGYPLAYSVPFDFEGERIEYCLSMNYLTNGNLEFHYSTWDSSSKSLEIPFEYFNDKFIEV